MSLVIDVLAPGYEAVQLQVEELLAEDPSWAFQLVVHAGEQTVVDLHTGGHDGRSLHLQASATKGVAGVALALALQRGALDVDAPVTAVWPEFGAHGKGGVTVAQLLSHQAGLVRTTRDFTTAEWGRAREVAADLAAQRPRWAPGRAHGYHALTIGPLADEIVHRLTGTQLWQYYEDQVRAPCDAEFWIRLPAAQTHRLRDVRLPPALPVPEWTGSVADEAVGQLDAMGPGNTWINSRELVAAGVPSVSGTGSARGLAEVYARAIGVGGRPALLRPDTVAAVSQMQVSGQDLVLGEETRYGVLFQKPGPRLDFGTAAAFGHDGAGGAIGFADPGTRVAFGCTTAAVPVPGGADRRAIALARTVRRIRLAGARTRGR